MGCARMNRGVNEKASVEVQCVSRTEKVNELMVMGACMKREKEKKDESTQSQRELMTETGE